MHHAHSAIVTVQASLLMVFLPDKRNVKAKSKHELDVELEMKEEVKKEFKDRISILAVAYHNLAVEQEFLKLYSEALESYRQAKTFALKYLGLEDGIYKNLNAVYDKAKQELTF
mmetsp:Transcript_12965/g.20080  ORF Transcript_12965/g.20080 Transcript_12965/m.20080 type:complete len:114 (+) Transcript_12965:458-799(+)